MTKRRIIISGFALVGTVLGVVFGALTAPTAERYTASVNVAMIPAPTLTTVEASSFWEVLTRGQISRTAAIVYEDPRWLASAAKAANVRQSDLTLTASALPDTSVIAVTVTASSPAAAEAGLSDVLMTAAPEVAAVTAPFLAKVLSPTQGAAQPVPLPNRSQVAAAGALAGLLAGGSIGWYVLRRRSGPRVADDPSADTVPTDDALQLDDVGHDDAVVEEHARHRGW